MFPVAAAVAGWLLLFFVLLVVPPREEGAAPAPMPGAEPLADPGVPFDPRGR